MAEVVHHPHPVPTHVKCSICELPWEDHLVGGMKEHDVNLLVCVRLLQAELAKRPQMRGLQQEGSWTDLLGKQGPQPLIMSNGNEEPSDLHFTRRGGDSDSGWADPSLKAGLD